MFPYKIVITTAVLAVFASAQQSAVNPQQPQIKVNLLNVCAPSADEQKELSSALTKIPAKPVFGADYEVARGRSSLDPNTPIPGMGSLPLGAAATADWVRIRREFPSAALFSNVQYSFSVDSKDMVETLVLRVRDPKPNDLMEVSVEDNASAVASATAMLSTSTPVSRVKLERFGKASVVLARCGGEDGNPATDQSAYEPIFRAASSIMERYRDALGARKMVPGELARLGVKRSAANSAKAGAVSKKTP